MFEKFELPSWVSLRDDDTIRPTDVVEDITTGERVIVGKSGFYKFLTGQRADQARHIPQVYDVVRQA